MGIGLLKARTLFDEPEQRVLVDRTVVEGAGTAPTWRFYDLQGWVVVNRCRRCSAWLQKQVLLGGHSCKDPAKGGRGIVMFFCVCTHIRPYGGISHAHNASLPGVPGGDDGRGACV